MRKRSWLAGTLAAIVLLAAAAIGIVAGTVDPNRLKPRLEAAVLRSTGRTLTLRGKLRIGGALHWRGGPSLDVRVTIDDVLLANLPGGTRPDMARVERIEADIAVLPLIQHRLRLDRLRLVGPNMLFEQANGKPNWVFSPATDPNAAPIAPSAEASQAASQASTPSQLDLRFVHVQNGMVTWHLPARTTVLGIKALDLRDPAPDGATTLDAVLVHADHPFDFHGRGLRQDGTPIRWTAHMTLSANGAEAVADGTTNLLGQYALQFDAQVPALEALAPLLPEFPLPPVHALHFATHLTNTAGAGDLPKIGETHLQLASADLDRWLPGLQLGAMTIAIPKEGAPAAIDGQASWRGLALGVTGTAAVPADPQGRAVLPVDLHATGRTGDDATPVADAALKGRVSLAASRFAGLDGTLTAHAPQLAALRPWTGPAVPNLHEVTLAGRITLPDTADTLTLHDAQLHAGEGELTADAMIGLAAPARLNGTLHAARLDGDALWRSLSEDTPSAQSGPAAPSPGPHATGTVIPETPLPWAALRDATIDVAGTVGRLTLLRQEWRDIAYALRLQNGVLHLSRFEAAFPAGPLQATLQANAGSNPPALAFTLHAPGIPLARLTELLGLPGAAEGAVALDADLHGNGANAHAVAATLGGTLSATMEGGSLTNAALIQLAHSPLQALNITVPARGTTAIACMELDGSFESGIGKFRSIALDTTHLKLDGAGTVDLGREALNLKLHPMARLSGASVSVPVLVRGPFRNIAGTLDADGLDKAGLLVDALFGGDTSDICTQAGFRPHDPANAPHPAP